MPPEVFAYRALPFGDKFFGKKLMPVLAVGQQAVVRPQIAVTFRVQAARVFPNVHLGGLWWYNFRASTYRGCMQMRLEALPASKCALVVSDARCIEWCYGKILFVKRLLADFLHGQIELGWLDREEALRVAGEWLHGAAASLYERSGPGR